MKKYIFTPIWMLENRERYLCNMEQKGYRIKKIKYLTYYFEKYSPHKAHYIYTFWLRPSMKDVTATWDYIIKSEYKGNEINKCFTNRTLYRIKDGNANLYNFKAIRAAVVFNELKKYLIYSFLFLIISILLGIQNTFWLLFLPFAMFLTVYSLIGLRYQYKVLKQYSK